MNHNQPNPITNTNLYTVFECICKFGPITKKEIQEQTALSWGSISMYTAGLLTKGIIAEKTRQQDHKGRNPGTYCVNQKQNWIIGLDVQMNRIIGNVLALDGTGLCGTVLNLDERNAPHVYENIVNVLSLLFRSVKDASQIRWIGLSMPGIIDFVHGKPMRVHHFTEAFPALMTEKLEERFGVPAAVFHDPDCMLMAHLRRRPPQKLAQFSKSSVILLRWSHGIGVSLMFNGELFLGDHCAAGEMGHMSVDANGPECICGKKGCLEMYAAMRSVIHKMKQCIAEGTCPDGDSLVDAGGNISKTAIWNAYRDGNPCVEAVVNSAVDHMALAVSNAVNLLDPGLLIVEGEFAAAPKACMERFSAKVNAGLVRGRPLNIQIHNWEISPAVGAAAMLVQRVFEDISR